MRKLFSIVILLSLALAAAGSKRPSTSSRLKLNMRTADQQGRLYAEIADKLVAVADKQFTDGESVKGHATVQEILQYATKAHDLAH